MQQGLKGIQIVTGNDSAFGWQLMQELSIAVIEDMEQIKVRLVASQKSWVIPEAVQEAIGIKTTAICGAVACEPPPHGWANACRLEHVSIIRLQVTEQHVCNQIHARPTLFAEVTNHSYAR